MRLVVTLQVLLLQLPPAKFEATAGKRWCHREVPVTEGVYKNEPPYWQYPGCPNLPFDGVATHKCMANRTLYVIGNSVGRQNAFGLIEILGGGSVKRENQR